MANLIKCENKQKVTNFAVLDTLLINSKIIKLGINTYTNDHIYRYIISLYLM